MTKTINSICGILLATTYPAFSFAQSSDIELIPPANGGFSVKSGSTNAQFFRINEAGEVFIKNLPNELDGTPLCWTASTGRLGKCSSGAFGGIGDIIPPTIETNLPQTAESSLEIFTAKYSDDTELAYQSIGNAHVFFGPGVKTKDVEQRLLVPLGEVANMMMVAADTSGNVTKLPVQISSPQTGFKLGSYGVVSGGTLPDGFNCSRTSSNGQEYFLYGDGLDGSTVTSAGLYASTYDSSWTNESSWSVAEGYNLGVSLQNSTTSIRSSSAEKIALEATTASIRSSQARGGGSGGYFEIYFPANLVVDPMDPSLVEMTIQMECLINDIASFGDEATLTLRAQ